MNKPMFPLIAVLSMSLGHGKALAQVIWTPVEVYGCIYNGATGEDEIESAIESFNDWADDRAVNDYTAILLEPYYTAASYPYDFLWAGMWDDATGLGHIQQWLGEGEDVREEFAEVAHCPLHQTYITTKVKEPADPEGIIPVEVSTCTVTEGRLGMEGGAAVASWSAYLVESGSESGQWIFRPGWGDESDANYTFKWVKSYPSWDSLGRDMEHFLNGGGEQRFGDIAGPVVDCDSPRVYLAQIVRTSDEQD